jgi:20S proteasome alpha/beta subunit
MTVGVIYRVAEGAVLVSDGRITHDGEIASESARKCFMCGLSTAVIVAGDIGPLWRRLQERPPKTFRAFRDAVDADTDDTDWLAYDRRSGRMWLSDVRITIPFAAVGSGATLATGALEALPVAKTIEAAEAAAVKAVRVACRRHALCGGRLRTLVVRR